MLPSLGDAVGVEPLISIVHELTYRENSEIWLRADDRVGAIFQGHPFIDKVLNSTQELPRDAKMVLNITESDKCPSIRSLIAGGRVNASRLFCDSARVEGKSVVYDGRGPKLYLTEEEKGRVYFIRNSIKKRKIGVQVKGGHWWKTYPHLKKLVGLLRDMDDVQVFLTHDSNAPFKDNGIITLSALPYRDLMVWLGAMDLFIGLDSGPTHLSAAIGTRTYGIYGPTDPKEILGMYGAHVTWNKFAAVRCTRERCWLRPCKKLLCLRALNPWVIMGDVKSILKENYVNPRIRPEASPIIRLEPQRGAIARTTAQRLPLRETIVLPASVEAIEPQVTHFPTTETNTQNIAIMRLDGMGGTATLSDHVKKLHEKTGDKVTLITRGYEILFEENPHVQSVINIGMRDWREASLVYRGQFDAMAELRFCLGKWYSPNGNFKQDFTEFEAIFDEFPTGFNVLREHGIHHVQLANKTLGLPYEDIETELFVDEAFEGLDGDFVLINNGVDVIHGSMRQTKCWEGWNDFVSHMEEIQVVQVGMLSDPPVEGVVDVRGQTNLKQLIYLIKKAKGIVVGEGGIMHLSAAVKHPKTIILGGPTQGCLFEYPGHIWITSHVCGFCWYDTNDWYEKCPKDCNAVCMKTILPQRVADITMEVLSENMVSN